MFLSFLSICHKFKTRMFNIAIAGGLGDLGRTIADAVLEYAPQHKLYILTRKAS